MTYAKVVLGTKIFGPMLELFSTYATLIVPVIKTKRGPSIKRERGKVSKR